MATRVTYELRLSPSLRTVEAIEQLSLGLLELGLPANAMAEQTIRSRRFISVYLSSRAEADGWLRRIQATEWRVTSRLTRLRNTDWQDAWKRHLKPFAVTRRLQVIPAWSPQARRGPDSRRIVLETGMAFGTGKHATTRWMAGFIEQLRGRFRKVLDIGTGTGILSVVAHRCGAERIVAVDVEPTAVAVARSNLRRNGCRAFRLVRADFARRPVPGTFDLILANIGLAELLAMRQPILNALEPGKYLAVTGILRRQSDAFRRQFDAPSLRCLRARATNDWVAFLYQSRYQSR